MLGRFDLVLALNDVINYLTGDGDLERALARLAANLAPGGMLVFDANSLRLLRRAFAAGVDRVMSTGEWRWTGLAADVRSGGTFEASLAGPGVEAHRHRQRHHSESKIRAAMRAAGLEVVAVLGQEEVGPEILLREPARQERDHKVIYVGSRPADPAGDPAGAVTRG